MWEWVRKAQGIKVDPDLPTIGAWPMNENRNCFAGRPESGQDPMRGHPMYTAAWKKRIHVINNALKRQGIRFPNIQNKLIFVGCSGAFS